MGPLAETKRLIDALVASGLTSSEAAQRIAALTRVLQTYTPEEILGLTSVAERARDAADRPAALAAASTEIAKRPRRGGNQPNRPQ